MSEDWDEPSGNSTSFQPVTPSYVVKMHYSFYDTDFFMVRAQT